MEFIFLVQMCSSQASVPAWEKTSLATVQICIQLINYLNFYEQSRFFLLFSFFFSF